MKYTTDILSEIQTWCHYADVAPTYETIEYGALYNWYAATDIRGIAAEGWHLPTLEEAQTLIDYHGGNEIAGTKMRETGSVYWDSEAEGFIEGTNDYGFNIRGAGLRQFFMSGEFIGLRINTAMWLNGYAAMGFLVNADMVYIDIIVGDDSKKSGAPIRLIKDSTTLSHGETGTYTGNDGKVYRTICIGTQEWLADNLCETLYRDGTPIPEVTDNSAWAALTTGARCSYDNNEENALTVEAASASATADSTLVTADSDIITVDTTI
jgi:uncharacterized protein (TIGR02145 family)